MLHYFKSEQGKLRDHAKNWIYLGKKVYHFRKDELSAPDLDELNRRIEELKSRLKARGDDGGKLKFAIEHLKGHLDKVGGSYYPRGSLADNVEFFFVALIIYVGLTTFVVKPFKIPTNSMWPTYYGMTGEAYPDAENAPNGIERAFRLIAYGATHYKITAPADGELMLPVAGFNANGEWVAFVEPATSRRFFVLPTPGKRVWLRVGEEKTSFKVLSDFSVESEAISPGLGYSPEEMTSELIRRLRAGDAKAENIVVAGSNGNRQQVQVKWVGTGKMFKKGDTVLEFDLMTGDQLFVDRMSYHFAKPSVGDGFVFKTENISERVDPDKFYIKRLAGTPGDSVAIDGTRLMVNGAPATGSVAFELNATQANPYAGYVAPESRAVLDLGEGVTVPERSYLALGDNSHNSLDSRFWGFVPAQNVVGRPIVIYYPFSKRFGLAK